MSDDFETIEPDPERDPDAGADPLDVEGDAESGDHRCQVVLIKGAQRYVFRYEPGEEAKLISDLTDMAQDPECDLNWFDAAVLSHQMGQRFNQRMEKILKA